MSGKMKRKVNSKRNNCCQDVEMMYQDLSSVYDEEHSMHNVPTRFSNKSLGKDKVHYTNNVRTVEYKKYNKDGYSNKKLPTKYDHLQDTTENKIGRESVYTRTSHRKRHRTSTNQRQICRPLGYFNRIQNENKVTTIDRTNSFPSIKEKCHTIDNSSSIKLFPVDDKSVKQDLSHKKHSSKLNY